MCASAVKVYGIFPCTHALVMSMFESSFCLADGSQAANMAASMSKLRT